MFLKVGLQMFYGEINAPYAFVGCQGHTVSFGEEYWTLVTFVCLQEISTGHL